MVLPNWLNFDGVKYPNVPKLSVALMHVQLVISSQFQSLLGQATFFHRDWSWNIFYGHFLPSADSRRANTTFLQKNVCKYSLTS